MKFFALFIPCFLASILLAADPPATESGVAPSTPSSATDAIAMLGKLPNPLVERHLVDFFATASTEDAGQVLMHIAISAVRPARAVVIPVLGHRDPQVVERALRALSSIGITSTELRKDIDVCNDDCHDAGTADLLTGILQQHESIAWILRRYLS